MVCYKIWLFIRKMEVIKILELYHFFTGISNKFQEYNKPSSSVSHPDIAYKLIF